MEYENFKEKVELTITYEEYQKLRKTCNYQFWKTFLIASLIIILFFSIALIPPNPLPIEEVVISDIFVIMVMFFFLKIRYVLFSKLDYKRFAKNKNQVEYKVYFYDKYIKLENEKMNLKINYEEVKKIKITSTDIYIIVNTKNIIPIPKHKINMNLIDYLYDRIPKTKIKKKIAIEEQQENLERYEKVKAKLTKLKAEFETLPAIIAEAREKGDLKENAEYHAAKERQGLLNAQISKLEGDLAGCEIIDPASLDKDTVTFGKRVKVKDKNRNATFEYRIVGELEADMSKNEITIVTPIAKGLLGKKVGDVVTIKVPAGDKVLEILEINI